MLFVIGSLFMMCFAVSPHDGASSQMITARLPNTYLSPGNLKKFCHAPGKCGKPFECEGHTSLVKGMINYDNVFEHSHYPRLPYEKFSLVSDDGNRLDVLAVSSDNAVLFKKIFDAQKERKNKVFIKGTIKGFDAPVMGTCRREILLEIKSPDDIYFR